MNLRDRTALITGGGSGIGLGIAQALAQEGCRVALAGRQEARLRDAVARFATPRPLYRCCDVADREQADALAQWALEALGKIDILVNSAGVNVARRTMAEIDPRDFDQIMAVNCSGLFNVLHAVLPSMRSRREGLIVNISSIAGLRALPLAGPAYAASKFAATALATLVRLEERAHGIRVTSVFPGEVDTPLLNERPIPVSAEQKASMVHPEDVGAMVAAIACLPAHVVVPELTIMPLYQEYL